MNLTYKMKNRFIGDVLKEDYLMHFHDEDIKQMAELIFDRAKRGDTDCADFILKQLHITGLDLAYKFNKRTGELTETLIPVLNYSINNTEKEK